MIRYDIIYNGRTGADFDIVVEGYPRFTGGQKQYTQDAVAGRLGELVGEDTHKTNLAIECTLGFIKPAFWPQIRVLKEWLSGTGKLQFSDTPETFFRVWKVIYGDVDRQLRRFGKLPVTFICTPYEYRTDGQIAASPEELRLNPYATCRPIYQITGEGICELTVNGYTATANVSGDMAIDTERMLAYRSDGVSQNTMLTADYERMHLPNGENSISITEGFALKIIPNWGYDV